MLGQRQTKKKKSEIVAILLNIVTPILVGTPTADVAPRAEVALEVIGEVEKMARDYIDGIMLLDPQNTYCFGGINAFEHVIRFLAELKNKYAEVQK